MSAAPAAPTAHEEGEISLIGLTKRFGDVAAVDGIDLEIPRGTFFSLLGPSGCGKTTTLRMIAGFEQPTAGRLLLDGQEMANIPPHRRNVNTVFQSYALFPHLSVYHNVAYGLRRKRIGKREVQARVAEALDLVQLTDLGRRHPNQLSGGQRQRVALARALVLRPAVRLLDEPLGALDAKLRKQLQVELKLLQEQVGITFVYVTHDQEEALTMSDQIAVMSAGRIEQVASPQTVYEEPATEFVADFLGVSNLMAATVVGPSGPGSCRIELGSFALAAARGATNVVGATRVAIRPERVRLLAATETGQNHIPGTVERAVYLGNATQLAVRLGDDLIVQALIQNSGDDLPFRPGDAVSVHLPAEALRVLDRSPAEGTSDEPAP